MKTQSECKRILFKLGVEFGVSPKLISERLLSEEDKISMLNEEITEEVLRYHVQAWKASGFEDLVGSIGIHKCVKTELRHPQGNNLPIPGKISCHYAPPFVCPDWRTDCSCRKEKTYR